jgi:hypothetical protein
VSCRAEEVTGNPTLKARRGEVYTSFEDCGKLPGREKLLIMRIVLRLLAAWTFFSFIETLGFVVGIWKRGGISWLVGTSPFTHLTALGWLITLVIGPPAVVLLWRQREAGRRASIVFWGSICLYYLLCLTFFRTSGTRYSYTLFSIFCSLILLALLFSPQAKTACRPRKTTP